MFLSYQIDRFAFELVLSLECIALLAISTRELRHHSLKNQELADLLLETQQNKKLLENAQANLLKTLQDTTLEKNRLDREKNTLETIINSIGDGLFVTDAEGRILRTNHRAHAMCGYTPGEIRNRHYREIFRFRSGTPADEPQIIEQAIKSEVHKELPSGMVLIRKNGRKIPVVADATPLKDSQGKIFGCVGVIHDTSREEKLRETKDDFLTVAAHQLRTPLGTMKWNLEMLARGDYGKIPVTIKRTLLELIDSDNHMIKLVNGLLNVSRIDRGFIKEDPQPTDVREIISKVCTDMKNEAAKKVVAITVDPSSSGEDTPRILIDRDRLRMVIENLVGNAIKYNQKHGTISISVIRKAKKIEISIADSGIGIPRKDYDRIFSKFYRAENAVKATPDGTGLGLFVVASYVKGWGGTLAFTSTVNKGSKFVITLPLDPKVHTLHKDLEQMPMGY